MITLKLRDPETKEETLYRNSLIYNEQKNSLGTIILIAVIAVLAIAVYTITSRTSEIQQFGPGNPYNCQACKNLGRACKRHHNYDKNEALKSKITSYVNKYDLDDLSEEQSQFSMYGYGNRYNTDCDFCKANGEECYADKYDRLYITEVYRRLLDDEIYKSLLCDDCYNIGKPKCDKCLDMTSTMIYNKILGINEVSIEN